MNKRFEFGSNYAKCLVELEKQEIKIRVFDHIKCSVCNGNRKVICNECSDGEVECECDCGHVHTAICSTCAGNYNEPCETCSQTGLRTGGIDVGIVTSGVQLGILQARLSKKNVIVGVNPKKYPSTLAWFEIRTYVDKYGYTVLLTEVDEDGRI